MVCLCFLLAAVNNQWLSPALCGHLIAGPVPRFSVQASSMRL